MPMIDVYAAEGTFASKHDLAQQLAAAVMRWEQVPPSRCSRTTPPPSSTTCPPTRFQRRRGQQLRPRPGPHPGGRAGPRQAAGRGPGTHRHRRRRGPRRHAGRADLGPDHRITRTAGGASAGTPTPAPISPRRPAVNWPARQNSHCHDNPVTLIAVRCVPVPVPGQPSRSRACASRSTFATAMFSSRCADRGRAGDQQHLGPQVKQPGQGHLSWRAAQPGRGIGHRRAGQDRIAAGEAGAEREERHERDAAGVALLEHRHGRAGRPGSAGSARRRCR